MFSEQKNVPAIFLNKFPDDYSKITNENERNQIFIKILAPLALKINEEILVERDELLQVINDFDKHQELTTQQTNWAESKAKKYDIFTRLKGQRRYKLILSELQRRIDIISPSVFIAAAAIETLFCTCYNSMVA